MRGGYQPLASGQPLGEPPRQGSCIQENGGMNSIERSAFDAPLNDKSANAAIISIAISLKRIADALEQR